MQKIIVVPYNLNWSIDYIDIGMSLRDALGIIAIRIDHIGSTAIPGMAAKPILDVQISVKNFDFLDTIKTCLEPVGYYHRDDNPDRTNLFFRENNPDHTTHIHVRRHGSWSEQFTLLFRDYLREHHKDAIAYTELKYRLAEEFSKDRVRYTSGKTKFIGKIMVKANIWSQQIGWQPPDSDN